MKDEEIIELYFSRSDKAIAVTKEKYERLCISIAMNMLNNLQDAEECLNDALMALWETIPPHRPESLKAYLCTTVKNFSLKKAEYHAAKKRCSEYSRSLEELQEILCAETSVERTVEEKELSCTINKFLYSLPYQKRILFVRRYYFLHSVKEIAADYKISEKNASARLARIRKQLKEFLTKEGYLNE